MKKKIITLVLAALSALSLAACRTGGNTPAGSTGTAGTKGTDGDVTYDANNILDKFDGKDFGGKDFRIYCANYFNDAVFVRQAPTEDADPADRINAALYKRDSQLEEKYKVKMVYTIAANDQVLADTAKELASTGEDAMDLLLGSLFYLGSGSGMLSDNLLTDIGEIKEIDLSNDWWNRNMTESFTLGGKTFFSTGDITTRGTTSVSLILFNKKLLEDEKTELPYQAVYDGTWTYEKLYQIYRGKSVDLDKDGSISLENDRIGFLAGSYSSYFGCGGRYTVRESDGSFTGVYNTPANINVLEKLQEWFNDDVLNHTYYPGVSAFVTDRAYFIEAAGCDLSLFRNMENEFGAVPFPKFNEEQKDYINFANPWITTCATFPITVKDTAFSGFMTEAMAALSKYTSSPEQYEVIMKNKELRDDDSKKMLEICVASATYDIGFNYNFGGVRSAIENILIEGMNPSSSFAAIGDKFSENLNDFIASVTAGK